MKTVQIKDPNNVAKRLDAKLITIPKEEDIFSDKKKDGYKVASLFSGCGGLDLGFSNAGFNIVYSNDNDLKIAETYEKNHAMRLDIRSIEDVPSDEIPDAQDLSRDRTSRSQRHFLRFPKLFCHTRD